MCFGKHQPQGTLAFQPDEHLTGARAVGTSLATLTSADANKSNPPPYSLSAGCLAFTRDRFGIHAGEILENADGNQCSVGGS